MKTATLSRCQILALFAAFLAAALLLALVPKAEADPAANIDRDPTGAPYIAGELLVTYKSGVSGREKDSLVRSLAADTLETIPEQSTRLISFPQIKGVVSGGDRGQRIRERVAEIGRDPRVASVDYNYVRTLSFAPNDPFFGGQWGLKKPGFPQAWDTTAGRGARVAVIDSGVARHPDLRSKILAQYDFGNGDRKAEDRFGHGTHVAGTVGARTNNRRGVAGACPNCGLLIGKVADNRGLITDAYLVRAINWSVKRRADVINMSLGGPGNSRALKRAVANASRRGVVVVAAAGNENSTRRSYPAAYPSALAVAATSRTDKRPSFSNRGRWVDVAAPGVDIVSTAKSGRYVTKTGTSMSSPHVAALAGLLASQGHPARRVKNKILVSAKDLAPRGRDQFYGHGRIDAAAAVR